VVGCIRDLHSDFFDPDNRVEERFVFFSCLGSDGYEQVEDFFGPLLLRVFDPQHNEII